MVEPYKRLDDDANVQSSSIDVDQINKFLAHAASGRVSRPLKMYKAMVLLSYAQTAIALLIFLIGLTYVLFDAQDSNTKSCSFGTGIWVGLQCLVSGGLGVMALSVPEGRKGYMIAYLVLSIFANIADGVLMTFSSIWIAMLNSDRERWYQGISGTFLNVVLLIMAFAHMTITIISQAFVCYNWSCCEKKPGVFIFYVPQTIQFLQHEGGAGDGRQPVIA